MSCGCNQTGCNECSPCTPALATNESLASALNNLIVNLFGTFTKTIVNGRAVWTQLCSASGTLSCYPRNDGEGFICYILRIMATLGVFVGGTYNAGTAYCAHTFVVYDGTSYVSLVATTGEQPDTHPSSWLPVAVGSVGPQGAQGDPGPAGPAANGNFAFRAIAADFTATNLDDVFFCTGMAGNIILTIPAMAGLSSGKGYQVQTDSSAWTVTIVSAGADTFDGAASIVLALAGESVILRSDFAGKWKTV